MGWETGFWAVIIGEREGDGEEELRGVGLGVFVLCFGGMEANNWGEDWVAGVGEGEREGEDAGEREGGVAFWEEGEAINRCWACSKVSHSFWLAAINNNMIKNLKQCY